MKSHTESTYLPTTFDIVFPFLADPANLPKWAVAFCQSIRRERDRWVAQTSIGELEIDYVCDARLGCIDIASRPPGGTADVAHSRLLKNGNGCEYVFTFFQSPAIPDELFRAQAEALKKELHVLQSIAGTLGTCPT